MLAVGVGAGEAEKLIREESCANQVVVACHNSPSSVTLSGDRQAIEKLKESADKKKIFARVLKTGGKAYHSHHMREAASKYLEYLKNESLSSTTNLAKSPMFSTVKTERLRDTPDSYWVENLNSPVLFVQGVQFMLSEMDEVNLLIEIGPHSALSGPIRQICRAVDKANVTYLPTLKRQENDVYQMMRFAGELWIRDASLDIEVITGLEVRNKNGSVETQKGSLLVDLPTYHWTYPKPALAQGRASKEHRNMKEPRHDILGRRTIGHSPIEPLWQNVLRQRDLPWLGQHKLAGEVMLPAAAYLALAVEAIGQLNSQSSEPLVVESYTIRDVVISSAIVVPDDDKGTETLFRLRPLDGKLEISNGGRKSQWYEFSASSCSYEAWKEAAHGLVGLNVKGKATDHKHHILPETPRHGNHLDWLDRERELGIDLGPAFHWITDVFTNDKSHIARGEMRISRISGLMEAESRYVLHPTVIDSCLQPFVELLHRGRLEDMRCGIIPTHFGEVTIIPPSADHMANKRTVQLWSDELGKRSYSSNVQLIGNDGALIMDMKDSRCLPYRAALPQEMQGYLQQDLYMQEVWNIDSSFLVWADEAGCFARQTLGKVIDVFLHKDATQCVLCIESSLALDILSTCPSITMTVGVSASLEKAFASAYTKSENLTFVDLETLLRESTEKYALVITPILNEERLQKLHGIMLTGGSLLICGNIDQSESWDTSLRSASFSSVEQFLAGSVAVAKALEPSPLTNGHHMPRPEALLVYGDSPSQLHETVSIRMQEAGWLVRSQPIAAMNKASCNHFVLLVDAEGPFLGQLDSQQLNDLIRLTDNASCMIWVTCGGLLNGDKPEYGMTAGAARTIRNEKGSLDLVTVDFDIETTHEQRVAELVADIAAKQRVKGRNEESEYCLHNGVAYVGRIRPHTSLNRMFVPESGERTTVRGSDSPALVADPENGAIVYLQKPLDIEDVEVRVAALGLSMADGADDTPFLNHEIVGTVTRVGAIALGGQLDTNLVAGQSKEHHLPFM